MYTNTAGNQQEQMKRNLVKGYKENFSSSYKLKRT